MDELKYMAGNYHLKPIVLETDDGQFQGMVLLYEGKTHEQERRLVPVVSGTYSEALEEAKALAHKIIDEHAIEDAKRGI